MNKWKIISIVLGFMLIISTSININEHLEQKSSRELFINHLYVCIQTASNYLDNFLKDYYDNDIDSAKLQIELCSLELRKIDNIIDDGRLFTNKLYHPEIVSFDFIADILIYGVNINKIKIDNVLYDNRITDKELEFIEKLINDLNNVYKEMSSENLRVDKSLSYDDLNIILNNFYYFWGTFEPERSPYTKLRNGSK